MKRCKLDQEQVVKEFEEYIFRKIQRYTNRDGGWFGPFILFLAVCLLAIKTITK